jgi:hypothetical protein
MKAHFSNRRRIKRYFKGLPMDTGYDDSYWPMPHPETREPRVDSQRPSQRIFFHLAASEKP